MIKQTQTSHQRYFNMILAILLILSVIGWVIDEERDNNRERSYQLAIVDLEAQKGFMVEGANKLFRSLKECRNEVDNDRS